VERKRVDDADTDAAAKGASVAMAVAMALVTAVAIAKNLTDLCKTFLSSPKRLRNTFLYIHQQLFIHPPIPVSPTKLMGYVAEAKK
jgi:hypothetical protein